MIEAINTWKINIIKICTIFLKYLLAIMKVLPYIITKSVYQVAMVPNAKNENYMQDSNNLPIFTCVF